MNTLMIALFAVVAAAAAAPANVPVPAVAEPIPIVSQQSDLTPEGGYIQEFETKNGIHQSEVGTIEGEGKEASLSIKGHTSYTAPDGSVIDTEYYADKTGFHARGAHIPEIPEYIARALEWNTAHPEESVPEEKAPKTV